MPPKAERATRLHDFLNDVEEKIGVVPLSLDEELAITELWKAGRSVEDVVAWVLAWGPRL